VRCTRAPGSRGPPKPAKAKTLNIIFVYSKILYYIKYTYNTVKSPNELFYKLEQKN